MKKETLKTRPSLRRNNRPLNASALTFDLPTLIEKMKHSHTWAQGEPKSMILLKSPKKQIVLMALHDETEINSSQSNNSITFQIIEGRLKLHTRKESVTLDQGQLLTLHENIKYRLTTMKQSVLLLTIANSTLKPEKN